MQDDAANAQKRTGGPAVTPKRLNVSGDCVSQLTTGPMDEAWLRRPDEKYNGLSYYNYLHSMRCGSRFFAPTVLARMLPHDAVVAFAAVRWTASRRR